mmetsp:Transcript_17066/g.34622  ORF Transcript_17066/g.34622 Transcript_17066/m.34622 type:complete len:205 (+) Transcript_17066:2143-2757(+)
MSLQHFLHVVLHHILRVVHLLRHLCSFVELLRSVEFLHDFPQFLSHCPGDRPGSTRVQSRTVSPRGHGLHQIRQSRKSVPLRVGCVSCADCVYAGHVPVGKEVHAAVSKEPLLTGTRSECVEGLVEVHGEGGLDLILLAVSHLVERGGQNALVTGAAHAEESHVFVGHPFCLLTALRMPLGRKTEYRQKMCTSFGCGDRCAMYS